MTYQDDSEIVIDSSWKCIRIDVRLKCPPFTWFIDSGLRIIKGAILVAPHVATPSKFLGGNYNLANSRDNKRFAEFNEWYATLEADTDYIKIRKR